MLDLSVDAVQLTAGAGRRAIGVRGREGLGRRGRAGLARVRPAGGRARRQRGARPHRARPTAPGRAGRTSGHRADRRQPAVASRSTARLYGCGTSDMKSGVAVALRVAHLIGDGCTRPTRRPHLGLLRLRGGRGRPQRARAARPRAPGGPARRPRASCSNRPTAWSRAAARARCGRWCARPACARTAPAPGSASNAIHAARRCSPGWPTTSRATSTSTG